MINRKKNEVLILLLFILGIWLLPSCQIDKRHYLKGYFFNASRSKDNNIYKSEFCFTSHDDTVSSTLMNIIKDPNSMPLENSEANQLSMKSRSSYDIIFASTINRKTVSRVFSECKKFKPIMDFQKPCACLAIPLSKPTKFHPFGYIGACLFLLSITSLIISSSFIIWGIVLWFSSIIALYIAKRQSQKDTDKWSGISVISKMLMVEVWITLIVLFGMIIILPVIL